MARLRQNSGRHAGTIRSIRGFFSCERLPTAVRGGFVSAGLNGRHVTNFRTTHAGLSAGEQARLIGFFRKLLVVMMVKLVRVAACRVVRSDSRVTRAVHAGARSMWRSTGATGQRAQWSTGLCGQDNGAANKRQQQCYGKNCSCTHHCCADEPLWSAGIRSLLHCLLLYKTGLSDERILPRLP
jgi:hypothetical protein